MASKRLNASIVIGGSITGALKGAFSTAGKSLTQLGSEVRRLSTEQKTLEKGITTFGKMGRNVDGLREKYASVTAELKKMRDATERLASIERSREDNLARRAELRGQMLDTVALGFMAAAPIKAAMDFESAMADVRKVVDFAEPQGLKNMSRSIVEMSQSLPMAADQIASIVAAGGQAGLAEADLTLFAESAVKMGIAFGITADEAGQMMAEMRSAFRMSQEEVNTLADKMNLLANTTAASESKIAGIVQRVGPLGEVAGVAAGEIAAIGATMVSVGVQQEVAATGIQNFMLALVAGESATKSQRAAMAELGLESTELAKGMQEDAEGTILLVLERLKALPEHMRAATMSQLFGKESIKALAPLLNVTDALRDNLAKVNDEMLYAGAVNKEYESRSMTTANSLQLFKNRMNALAINLGNVMLPAVNSLLGAIGPIVTKFADLTERFPVLTKLIIGGATAMVAGRVAFLGLAYGMTFVKGAILAVRAALMTNPITAIVTGIATAAWLIYENWEPISAWFKEIWGTVKKAASGVWDWYKENLSWTPLAMIVKHWEPITKFFGNLWDGVSAVAQTAWDTIKSVVTWDPLASIAQAWEPVKTFFLSTWEYIESTFRVALDWITKKIEWVSKAWEGTKSLLGFGDDTDEDGQSGKGEEKSFWGGLKSMVGLGEETSANAQPKTPPALPEPAQKSAAPVNNYDQSQFHFSITQMPGEDGPAFADRVAADIRKRQEAARRSSLLDGAYAQ